MLRAAIKLVAQKGPRSMTLNEVGEASGYSGGLVTYRFGSKSGLLKAVSERILQLWYERVLQPALEEGATPDTLIRVAREYLANVRKRSELMIAQVRLMNASHSSLPELAPYFSRYDERVRGDLAMAVARGHPDDVSSSALDPQAFATVYVGMLRGIALQHFINDQAFDVDDVMATIELICHRALE